MEHWTGFSIMSPATHKMVLELSTSGMSVCAATGCTNPIDVVKVRVQLAKATGKLPGLLSTGAGIVKNEGMIALWKGVTPAMLRGLTYGGLRLGLYTPIKDLMGTDKNDPWSLYKKIVAGIASGSLAAGITNPTELVKTRLQAVGCPHTSSSAVVRDIMATNGVLGLWRGTLPSMARASLLTASQCASYDVIKTAVVARTGGEDNLATQFIAGAMTGVITTTVTSPADVLKTMMFVDAPAGKAPSGLGATVARILAEEGPAVFFKGWVANYARLGPQTMLTFLCAEQLRRTFGLNAL